MSRRRYLSTDISTDKRINKLAREVGDFAALLYTWMIPHAADDATLTGNPEELMYIVIPGRRDKEPEDVATALAAMDQLGLIEWDRECEVVRFPESFYQHQTYITEKRRGARNGADASANQREVQSEQPADSSSAQNRAKPRTSPRTTADQREDPQTRASFSSSLSASSSFPVPVPSSTDENAADAASPPLPDPDPVEVVRVETRRTPKPVLDESATSTSRGAERERAAAARAPNATFALLEALCEALDQDVSDLGPGQKKRQLGVAKRLADDGMTPEEVSRMVRWLAGQSWIDGGIDLFLVEKKRTSWQLAGKPDRVATRASGRTPSRVAPMPVTNWDDEHEVLGVNP